MSSPSNSTELPQLFRCRRPHRTKLTTTTTVFSLFLFFFISSSSSEADERASASNPLRVLSGVPDATASVGRLFSHSIPSAAFAANDAAVSASEAGAPSLPHWLAFDAKTGIFYGVPSENDAGQTFVSVTATGRDGSVAKDVFAVTVTPEETLTSAPYPLKSGAVAGASEWACLDSEPRTEASVVVEGRLERMSVDERVDLLERMARFVKLPPSSLRLLPASPSRPAFSSSALVAGAGDAKGGGGGGGVFITWLMGCGHDFTSANIAILETVEHSARDGRLSAHLDRGIVGWRADNVESPVDADFRRQRRHKRRPQRHIYATATLEPDRVRPTDVASPYDDRRRGHGDSSRGRHRQDDRVIATAALFPSAPPSGVPTIVAPSRVSTVTPTTRRGDEGSSGGGSSVGSGSGGSSGGGLEPASTPTKSTERKTETLPDFVATTATTTTTTTTTTSRRHGHHKDRHHHHGVHKDHDRQTHKEEEEEEEERRRPPVDANLGKFECVEGKYCEHHLPDVEEMFRFGDAGGSDGRLELQLLRGDGLGMPQHSWIRYDAERNMIYGLPLKDDVKPRVLELVLVATDSTGNVARDAITVKVLHPRGTGGGRRKKFNHELIFKFEMELMKFKRDLDVRIRFLKTLASVFNSSMDDILITRVKGGSTAVGWTNSSLPFSPCPVADLKRMKETVFDQRDRIKDSVIRPMAENDFILSKVSLTTHGPCDKMSHEVVAVDDSSSSSSRGDDDDPAAAAAPSGGADDADVWITTVLPAVVIAVILVLAACIACILYKKSRRGKLTLGEKRTFLNKGIPVIFVDELQDHPEPPHTPLILRDEKPPLPPPEYPRSSNGSAPSTPPSEHKEPLSTTEDEHDDADPPSPTSGHSGSADAAPTGHSGSGIEAPPSPS